MRIPEAAVELVKQYEGLRLESYRCPADTWTIGYGTTRGVLRGMQITAEDAEWLLMRDLNEVAEQLRPLIDVPLTDNQFGALVSFAHNCGVAAFRESTLRLLVNAGDLASVPAELMHWTKATIGGVKRVLPGLVGRREAEGRLWQTP